MYAEQQEQPSGGDAEASAESGSDDDDAVDAEFEEVKEEEK
jgi:hypothetical protein